MTTPVGRLRLRVELLRSGLLVALTYGSSVGILLVAEVALSRSISAERFGEYQYVRQLLPLLVALALFGVDQALTRHVTDSRDERTFRPLLKQSILLALAVSIVASAASASLFDIHRAGIIVLAGGPCLLVVSELSAAILRSRRVYPRAVLAQQGYRLLGGLFILILLATQRATGDLAVAGLAIAALIVGTWAAARAAPRPRAGADDLPVDIRRLRLLGAGFGISMLSLAAIDWVDQAAVAHAFGGLADSGRYAAAKLLSVYPFVSIASIIGFIALPEVIKHRDRLTPRSWNRLALRACLAALALWAVAGSVLVSVVPTLAPGDIPSGPVWILAATGVLRLLYLLPSCVVGAVGSGRLLTIGGLLSLGAVLIEVAVIVWWWGGDSLVAGACGLLAATLIRVLIAFALARSGVRRWTGAEAW